MWRVDFEFSSKNIPLSDMKHTPHLLDWQWVLFWFHWVFNSFPAQQVTNQCPWHLAQPDEKQEFETRCLNASIYRVIAVTCMTSLWPFDNFGCFPQKPSFRMSCNRSINKCSWSSHHVYTIRCTYAVMLFQVIDYDYLVTKWKIALVLQVL